MQKEFTLPKNGFELAQMFGAEEEYLNGVKEILKEKNSGESPTQEMIDEYISKENESCENIFE